MVQLFETLTSRHGAMLVGETLTGKSGCLSALASALTQLSRVKLQATSYKYKLQVISYKL